MKITNNRNFYGWGYTYGQFSLIFAQMHVFEDANYCSNKQTKVLVGPIVVCLEEVWILKLPHMHSEPMLTKKQSPL